MRHFGGVDGCHSAVSWDKTHNEARSFTHTAFPIDRPLPPFSSTRSLPIAVVYESPSWFDTSMRECRPTARQGRFDARSLEFLSSVALSEKGRYPRRTTERVVCDASTSSYVKPKELFP